MTYIPEARIEAQAARLRQQHALTPGFGIEQLLDNLGLGPSGSQFPTNPAPLSSDS
jgi:hypothetical protein